MEHKILVTRIGMGGIRWAKLQFNQAKKNMELESL